jgi:hypothetical protein
MDIDNAEQEFATWEGVNKYIAHKAYQVMKAKPNIEKPMVPTESVKKTKPKEKEERKGRRRRKGLFRK